MVRAFSNRYRWHKRFVPITDRPKVANKLMLRRGVLAVSDEVQL
jgi:hypothetical protein